MSAANCIPDLVAAGKITGKRAEEAMKAYRRHEGQLVGSMSPDAAAAEASLRVVDEMERTAAQKKRVTLLQVQAQRRMIGDLETFKGKSIGKAAEAMLAADERAPFANVDAQANAIRGRAQSMIEGVLRKHSRNLLGEARSKADLEDLVRERFGEATGNASAKELADAFGASAEMLRGRFNRAGGDIGNRADWGLPQVHDGMRVRAAGYDAWKAAILPRLDLGRMVDGYTGRAFTPDALEDALRDAYGAIASDGWTRRDPGAQGRGSMAAARAKHRFFVFKSADDWMGYQEQFGTGSAFDAMVGHVDGMANEIAMMERLGPNPEASIDWLKDVVEKQAATDLEGGRGDLDAARGSMARIDALFDQVSGKLNSPVNERWARGLGGTRNFLTSALLGSASMSAVTDLGFQATTRGFNGLPITSAIGGYVKMLNPFDAADRRMAVRLGLQAEEAARRMASLGRLIDQSQGPEVAARLSDAVLRMSGLGVWTQAGRWDFGLSVFGHIADQRHVAFGELDGAFRGMLERYGVDAADWAAIGKAEMHAERGGEWLDPMALDEALGDKVLRMVATEVDFAVPSATARAKATLQFGQRPGTIGGEIMRNAFLFKSFGVSMVLTHGTRMMSRPGAMSKLGYFTALSVSTTLLGALAVQLNEIANGRDPLAMGEGSFWAKAALKGGGYGIFGDFIDSVGRADQFGSSPAAAIAGPVVSFATDVAVTAKHAGEYAWDAAAGEGEDAPNVGRDAVKLLKRYMPGGSLWYAKLAYQRALLDRLQSEIDPNYAESWARLERARMNDQGQGFWWGAGEASPTRAPEFSEGAPE